MINRIKQLIKTGEKINVEFKLAQGGLPKNIYETVCSFANHFGGVILCGVLDDGTVHGLPPKAVTSLKKNFIKDVSSKVFCLNETR